MYSREYFYSIKTSITEVKNQKLIDSFKEIDKILFKEQFDNWRLNNTKKSFLKKSLTEIGLVQTELNSYLNKISNKNFELLSEKIIELYKKNSIGKILIESIFNKSVKEPYFCPFYVKLLKKLDNDTIITDEIEIKISNYLEILNNDNIKQITDNYDDFCENNKKKIFKSGYSHFIGELYLNKLLDYKIVLRNLYLFIENINTILSSEITVSFLEDNLICLDKLLNTIKNSLENTDRDKLIKYLTVFIKNENLSKRFKFKMMDLKDSISM